MDTCLQISATLGAVSASRLAFRVRAKNVWTRDIYLFNRLCSDEPSDERRIDPARVSVFVEGETLRLSKQLFDVPDEVDVESPEVPFVSRLAPDAVLEEEIALALPARERHPYRRSSSSASASTGQKRICERLVFTLGYFVAKDSRWVREVTVGGEKALATDYGFAIQTNQSVSVTLERVRSDCLVGGDPLRRPRG
jgi:hypothetical protein